MRNRNLVSLSIAFGFPAIAATGLCLYFGVKANAIEIIHVLFGLLFTGLVVFHIIYNFASLKNYSHDRRSRRLKKELMVSLAANLLLLATMCSGLPYMEELSHAGRSLFAMNKKDDRRGPEQAAAFTEITTNTGVKGTALRLIVRVNQRVLAPVAAIWAADTAHQVSELLFLPAKKTDLQPAAGIKQGERKFGNAVRYSPLEPGLLPVYSQQNPHARSNYDQPPPFQSFLLDTHTSLRPPFIIYLEMRYKDTVELHIALVDGIPGKVFPFTSATHALLHEAVVYSR